MIQYETDGNECLSYDLPSVKEFESASGKYGIVLYCIGAVALVITILIFIDTLRHILKHAPSKVKSQSTFVNALYPVICLLSYVAILVPRAHLLCEALTQSIFMSGMYQLFCLFIGYCGGEGQLVKKAKEATRLSLKVGPCCCWPCCSLLPTLEISKKTIKTVKILILQLPVVQGLVYFIILVMWTESESLYQVNYMYIQPIIIISILLGIWGMLMTIQLLKELLDPKFLFLPKFGVLQMVLILSKIQGITTRLLVTYQRLPCHLPITPQVYGNMIHNTLMVLEMTFLGYMARIIYKRSLPGIHNFQSKSADTGNTVNTAEKINNNHLEGTDNLAFN